MAGEVVHVEIPADDTAKGREFWGSLFGWEFQSYPGPFEYHMTQISPQTGGAISDMEPGKHELRVYFAVDDINAGAARVKELGGEADDPRPVPSMGWFAICKDANGNEFGIWQNDPSAPAPSE
jgi:predicted enzyme related to lactoylglutathione lyase